MTCKECFHFEVCDGGRHIGEYIEDDGIYSEGVEKECITFIPTADVVEVVRCKDCVHWGGATYGFICRKFSGIDTKICMSADHYCSYGERREE